MSRDEECAVFSEEVKATLTRSGWFPGRNVEAAVDRWSKALDTPKGFQISAAARRALAEFGALKVDAHGPGKVRARLSFVLDPAVAKGEEDRFAEHEAQIGSRLYPLGEAEHGHAFIAMADDGRVFLVMDDFYFLGDGIEEAVANLITGDRPPGDR